MTFGGANGQGISGVGLGSAVNQHSAGVHKQKYKQEQQAAQAMNAMNAMAAQQNNMAQMGMAQHMGANMGMPAMPGMPPVAPGQPPIVAAYSSIPEGMTIVQGPTGPVLVPIASLAAAPAAYPVAGGGYYGAQ